MSYQEKRSLSTIAMGLIVTTVYFLIVLVKYNNGDFDTSNMMKLWSIIILVFIPVSVVGNIILQIINRIFLEIGREISGNKEENIDLRDERDKLVELKGTRISLYIFVLGFLLSLTTQLFDLGTSAFFITLLSFGLLSSILGSVSEIIYYRRGV